MKKYFVTCREALESKLLLQVYFYQYETTVPDRNKLEVYREVYVLVI